MNRLSSHVGARLAGASGLLAVIVAASIWGGCRPKCTFNGQCASGELCLNGACVAPPTDAGPMCAASQRTCQKTSDCTSGQCSNGCCVVTACQSNGDCSLGEVCSGGTCVQANTTGGSCTSNSDCGGATPLCLTSTSMCVACAAGADCPDSRDQCSAQNTCVLGLGYCTHTSDCALLPATPVCDTNRGACVGCLLQTDCQLGQVCGPGETCVLAPASACTETSDCSSTDGGPTDGGLSDGGVVDKNSDAGTPYCDVSSGLCVACTSSTQCRAGQTCQGGACVESNALCITDSDCADGDTPHCAGALGECVACTSFTQCPSGSTCDNYQCSSAAGGSCEDGGSCSGDLFCDPSVGKCVPCVASSIEDECVSGSCQSDVCANGCAELATCITECGAIGTCASSCLSNTTASGQLLFKALDECLFVTACPDASGGVCDTSAGGYSAVSCASCREMAEGASGTCGAQMTACQND